jgi:hypothetical protein
VIDRRNSRRYPRFKRCKVLHALDWLYWGIGGDWPEGRVTIPLLSEEPCRLVPSNNGSYDRVFQVSERKDLDGIFA